MSGARRRPARGPCTPARARTSETDPSSRPRSFSRASRVACSFGLHDADEGDVPVPLGPVEAIAHDEPVGDREAEVRDWHLDLGPGRLVEERADLERARLSRPEEIEEVRDGEP